MEPFKIIKDLHTKHEINGNLDFRVTMSRKGIKVNFGMGTYSKDPTTFDLNEAILLSAKTSIAYLQHWMTINTKDQPNSDLLWQYTKKLKFFNDVVEKMSPKKITPDVDERIPGVGC
jgi:hypothetical protein